mmetsp:Transcript_4244/g.12224  ORF Transcript_4244/g.12224 Transcript_4244/m.12224 type:complete len:324 (-) Transcript_4244:242-1213(-)
MQEGIRAAVDGRYEVAEVGDLPAVERQDLRVDNLFVSNIDVGGKHLAEHHDLLVGLVRHRVHHLLKQPHRCIIVVVLAVLALEIWHGHGCEHEPSNDEVAGRKTAGVERHQAHGRLQPQRQRARLALLQHLQQRLLVVKLLADEVAEADALAASERHSAIIGNGHVVERHEHVAAAEVCRQLRRRLNAANHHAFVSGLHVEHAPHVGVLQLLPLDPEAWKARVLSVARVVSDEVAHYGRGDDVADVLGVLVLERLERNPDALATVVERRPAAVAAVDRRINLYPEELCRAMHVTGDLDAADDAARHAHRVAANGVPNDSDRVL